ncbi:DUF664 domain-containing protein [Kitasatospora acidiphila]|uniref:DUF664 domain-containing protein n=1 Tax=Kitasatospora acidiphila TaxID=2567942 RepID=A0A540VX06_9ACTN|nr:DUF664 domain-containing protein [Kitasatospora acidiphila]TQF01290.1 DUF664 domain-containing protein [Kitasatospora acidiphila]
MNGIPVENLSPRWSGGPDTREPLPRVGGERELPTAFLDFDFGGAEFAADLAVWRAECERSRAVVAAARSLDELAAAPMTGEPVTLRWILINTVAEYARHNGHADLLRERPDGATGF